MNSPTVLSLPIMLWHELALRGEAPLIRIPVHGRSMRPLIRGDSDQITIAPLSRPVRTLDIVLIKTAEKPARYLLHRVWKIENGRVQTLGDGCFLADEWVAAENVLGVAVLIERGGRRIDPAAPRWRARARVWVALMPLRKGLAAAAQLPLRALRKMKRLLT